MWGFGSFVVRIVPPRGAICNSRRLIANRHRYGCQSASPRVKIFILASVAIALQPQSCVISEYRQSHPCSHAGEKGIECGKWGE